MRIRALTRDMDLSNPSSDEHPLLSICIPTYNRAPMLKVCLASIIEQLDDLGGKVEIIVSDNCSVDGTEKVIRDAMETAPIIFNRNDRNIGAAQNFKLLANNLANGEFCWLIGDDDFLRKNSLKRLIKLMEDNPEVDMFYTNGMHIPLSEVIEKGYQTSSDFPDTLRTDSHDLRDREVDSISKLIDPENDRSFLGALMYTIFRRKIWVQYSSDMEFALDNFENVESTYPHAIIFATGMRGRKVFRVGNPVIVVGDGARWWRETYPMVAHIRLLELMDIYEKIGLEVEQIDKCRRNILLNCVPDIIYNSIIKDNADNDYQYKRSIRGYILYKEFWMSFIKRPIDKILAVTLK